MKSFTDLKKKRTNVSGEEREKTFLGGRIVSNTRRKKNVWNEETSEVHCVATRERERERDCKERAK